jgi:predicted nucleic acid-binding Zn ribbon protein
VIYQVGKTCGVDCSHNVEECTIFFSVFGDLFHFFTLLVALTMQLASLQTLLQPLERQYQTPAQQQWRSLLTLWPSLVGEQLAAQTKPLRLQDQVLQVSVANPVLGQTLMFERSRWVKKLNQALGEELVKDLRFSTIGWYAPSRDVPTVIPEQPHPCRWDVPMPNAGPKKSRLPNKDPIVAFAQWEQRVRDRAKDLFDCPRCGSFITPGELARWGVCSCCYAQDQFLHRR